MKTIKEQFKSIALILSMLVFFQGCTIYKSTPVTLDEAFNAETKVKVRTHDNETLKYDRITINNGAYYGVKETGNIMTRIPLEKEEINKIQIKNKPLSTTLTVGAFLVTAGAAALLILASSMSYKAW